MNAQNPMWSGMINHYGVVVQRFLKDDKADWNRYGCNILNGIQDGNSRDIESFLDNMMLAADDAFSKKKVNYTNKYRIHWWDDDVAESVQARRIAFSLYSNLHLKTIWKQDRRELKQ
ncbi:hypothetical protein HHI36_002082 [Cryptolaemus montrouzieri]|uniref:Uncharacterized protein n=1 Tax=Cryptolaemus montrouzieri TaxID=559131 RepID=A0ABD2P9G5_9CUCU